MQPLEGIRVLDLSRVLAGPWAGMVLSDLGADVVKIESPDGDDTRGWGPPWAGGEAAYFLCANRNKRSVLADFKDPESLRIVRALAEQSDILVENFKTGGLAKFGLDYASLAQLNPRLIYCSVSGYGRTGSRATTAGYDFVIQAEGGLMAITGETAGVPMKVGVAIADLFSGQNAVQAILAALYARERTGRGQHIDIALLDGQIAMLANVGSSHLVSGRDAARFGNAHPSIVPYQVFQAADGAFALAIGNDRQFATLCRDVIGRPELAADPRFVKNADRSVNRAALLPELDRSFATRPRDEWLALLLKAGLPSGAIRTVAEALAAPEVQERGMITEVQHPTAGVLKMVASPLKLSDTPVRKPAPPPLLGQHTAEVLTDLLGMEPAAAEAYRARLSRSVG